MKKVVFASIFSLVAFAAFAQAPQIDLHGKASPFRTFGDGKVSAPPAQPATPPKITRTVKRILVCKLTTPACDEHNAVRIIKKTPADNIVCGPQAFGILKVTFKVDEHFEMICDSKN